MNPLVRSLFRGGVIVALALALAGCGRRGALELPPGSQPPRGSGVAADSGAAAPPAVGEQGPGSKKPDISIKPNKPFVLDPLI